MNGNFIFDPTNADRMIVGNAVLADWAAGRCADVRVIPTCVEPSDYRPRTAWDIGRPPVIGWIGSPATEPYLTGIAPALATGKSFLEPIQGGARKKLNMLKPWSPTWSTTSPSSRQSRSATRSDSCGMPATWRTPQLRNPPS